MCANRLGLLATALALGACGSDAPPAVSVGPVGFTEDQLLGLSAERRRTLANLTAFGLAVADSSTTPLGAPFVDSLTADRRLEILAADLLLEANGVGDDVLEAQYLTDPEWELVVRHVLFFSERWRSASHRDEAAAKAERALASLRAGANFATTAAELSEEPGAEGRQGLLTPGRLGSWVPEFWAAAVALEPGEISPVTETQYGFHILRLEDRQVVPFVEARSAVARRVADQIGDPDVALEAWYEDAGASEAGRDGAATTEARAAALAEAERRGLSVPDSERAALARTWDDQVYRWSATLGFRYGMSTDGVAAAAFGALSDPGQGVELVRREVSDHEPLLTARYVISFADPS